MENLKSKLLQRSEQQQFLVFAATSVSDVIFREDDRIIWNRNFARNEAIIRRCALNLIKKFQEISSYRIGKAKMALKTIRKLLVGNDGNMTILLQAVKGVT